MRRARGALGVGGCFSASQFNCEDLTHWFCTGRAFALQRARVLRIAGLDPTKAPADVLLHKGECVSEDEVASLPCPLTEAAVRGVAMSRKQTYPQTVPWECI